MHGRRQPLRLALALALLAAGSEAAAQPGGPAPAPDEQSYAGALGAVWNYQTCGVRRAGLVNGRAPVAELAALERLARAKGLGPTLERVRADYERRLAVASMTACGGGPRAAFAAARRALAAFRTWVERARALPVNHASGRQAP